MTLQEAKETVIMAGKKLVDSGLIARTWGNVSCRISSTHFVITPSGRDYMSLTPEDIVTVAISDCSYSGSIKPSSEKGIHAEVYKLYPEANFVIHTHQNQASAVSVLPLDAIQVNSEFTFLHGEVILAGYGLPGTKKLRRNVVKALTKSKGNAVIMKHHGALCFGRHYEDTFLTAQQLELACERFIQEKFSKSFHTAANDPTERGYLILLRTMKGMLPFEPKNLAITIESERTANGFRIHTANQTYEIIFGQENTDIPMDTALSNELEIHAAIYKGHPEINYVLPALSDGIMAFSHANRKLRPLLDDFAQITGSSVKTVSFDASEIHNGLKHAPAVFIKKSGALCCGSTKGDAFAVSLVTEKNCNSFICAALFDKISYINRFECALMRMVYKAKYSKLQNKH